MKKFYMMMAMSLLMVLPLAMNAQQEETEASEGTAVEATVEEGAEQAAEAAEAVAEEPAKKGVWTTSSTPALKIDQAYYNNWSASGNAQLALTASFNGNYKYTNTKDIWDNVVDLALGMNWQDLDGKNTPLMESLRKSEDKIDLTSTYSRQLKKAWNVNAMANFKTQFYKGFQYGEDTVLISRFMAPAYLTTAIGFEYKKEWWNVSLSFLTGKTTFVCDDNLIDAGYNYGVPQKHLNDPVNPRHTHAYFGLGSYVKFYMKKDIAKNLNLYARVELFYDYMKRSNLKDETTRVELYNKSNEFYGDWNYGKQLGFCLWHEMDIDVEMRLEYRFSSWLAAYASFQVRYDSDFGSLNDAGNSEMCKGAMGAIQFYQTAGLQVYFNWKTPKEG